MIVVDTSAILAYMDSADRDHEAVASWLDAEASPLVTTPLIVAEADHLVAARGGRDAAAALREDLASGAYLVEWWPEATAACARIAAEYAGLGLGMADASLIALADRAGTVRIATLDERHFRSVRPLSGAGAFALLPADA